MTMSAILVAAGSGNRMGGIKKQYELLAGKPLFLWSAEKLANFSAVVELVIVVPKQDVDGFWEKWLLPYSFDSLRCKVKIVAGGETREESVQRALSSVDDRVLYVLIHDAARPFISEALLGEVEKAVVIHGAVTVAVPAIDTIKISTDGLYFEDTLNRQHLWHIQTPQCFKRDWIVAAHMTVGAGATDDTFKVEKSGHKVGIVLGDYRNIKVTTAEDWAVAKVWAGEKMNGLRIGQGWDLHRTKEGRRLVIGGVKIPSAMGLDGHSDADVLTHAIIDSLLGGARLGNIGLLFPDTDSAYLEADSMDLLALVKERVYNAGYEIVNIDSTVIAEAPKLANYLYEMEENIAAALGIAPGQVSVKAKTSEKVDAVGRGEAIAAQSVCLLR